MSCKLVSITPECEKLIAYCARVSNAKNQENENIEGLLKYCYKNQHWSIFELGNMVIEINTSCAIANQILRHRSFTFQQFSQRYAKVEQDLEVPALRRKHKTNRQMSIDDLDDDLVNELQYEIKKHFEASNLLYKRLLSYDIASESARFVLPLNTPTKLYMNGTIRSWIHYINLRSANGTQIEHQHLALEIKKIFQEQLPIIGKLID